MKEKKTDYFVALYDVAMVINASLDPSKVLDEIVRCIVGAMQIKACSIRLLDSQSKQLILGAACGLSKDYLHKGPILVKESRLDQKVLSGETTWLKNVQTDMNFQYGAKAKAEGIKSVLALPLMLAKNPIGVLRVYSDKIHKFNDDETKFLKAIANLSAIALDNAKHHKTLQTCCDLMNEHKYRIDDN
ncbi:MAG TPA: GAF domain-containing protein [Syntrophaceae bacterium]|jgi:signal transduction protein with GAF and PtsI domain|nr:GAF domain-containing protein [Syntrophaceae bacterium]